MATTLKSIYAKFRLAIRSTYAHMCTLTLKMWGGVTALRSLHSTTLRLLSSPVQSRECNYRRNQRSLNVGVPLLRRKSRITAIYDIQHYAIFVRNKLACICCGWISLRCMRATLDIRTIAKVHYINGLVSRVCANHRVAEHSALRRAAFTRI